MKKHLEPGEWHYYPAKFMERTIFVDYRRLDGTLLGVHAVDEADALDWIAAKRAADRPHDPIDFAAVASQRERRSSNV